MFDPVSQAVQAASARSAYAFAPVFAAGAVTSIGPCVAPRFIAVAGLSANRGAAHALAGAAAFVAGLACAYASLGALAGLLLHDARIGTAVYAAVAAAFAVGGIATLCSRSSGCAHSHGGGRARSAGAAFLLGASFSFVVAPCCTPIVMAILAYAGSAGDPLYGSALLGVYALGHALPVFAAAAGARGAGRLFEKYAAAHAASLVAGTLMLAISAYYAVLA